jgi:sugar phosphate isomerase/epimerase
MRTLDGHPELCAVNTATFGFQAPLERVIEEVARAGFGGIAPWRREVEGHDVKALGKRLRDAGLKVTGYCRSTYFTAPDRAGFLAAIEDNKRAMADAATLGAQFYALVVGSGRDLPLARAQVAEALGLLLPHAKACGVKLAVEPLHPVYAADRACINTIAQGLELCTDPDIGLLVDAYHVWWDPNLAASVATARGHIFGFHVSDWLMPVRDVLNDRGMMGDGILDLPAIRALVEAAGYDGLVEVEIFSDQNWWKRPIPETCRVMKERLFTRV